VRYQEGPAGPFPDLGLLPQPPELRASAGQLADEGGQRAVVRVEGERCPQLGGNAGCDLVPFAEEHVPVRIKENQPRVVARVLVAAVDRPAEAVGGHHLERLVSQGGKLPVPLSDQLGEVPADPVARPRHLRPRRRDREQVPMGVGAELERAGEGIQRARRGIALAALLQPGVVVETEAGQLGDFFASKPRYPARAAEQQSGLIG